MRFEDYRVSSCRQDHGTCVAEIPAILGRYASMNIRESAEAELTLVLEMIKGYREKGGSMLYAG